MITTSRTFWNADSGGYTTPGTSTQLRTRWGTLHIEHPDDAAASFWWDQKNHGVLTIPAALRRMWWALWLELRGSLVSLRPGQKVWPPRVLPY